jgi:hypothetical protein
LLLLFAVGVVVIVRGYCCCYCSRLLLLLLTVPQGKWNEIQHAWRTITGLEDVNAGGLPMNDPALLYLLGSIFCKASDNPLQRVDLLERIRRDRRDIEWLADHFDAASLETAKRLMSVFGCIFDLDDDGELLWPEFVSGVVILTHGTVEEKAEGMGCSTSATIVDQGWWWWWWL